MYRPQAAPPADVVITLGWRGVSRFCLLIPRYRFVDLSVAIWVSCTRVRLGLLLDFHKPTLLVYYEQERSFLTLTNTQKFSQNAHCYYTTLSLFLFFIACHSLCLQVNIYEPQRYDSFQEGWYGKIKNTGWKYVEQRNVAQQRGEQSRAEEQGERSISFDVWESGRNVIKSTAVEAQPVPKRWGIRRAKPSNLQIKWPCPSGTSGKLLFQLTSLAAHAYVRLYVCCRGGGGVQVGFKWHLASKECEEGPIKHLECRREVKRKRQERSCLLRHKQHSALREGEGRRKPAHNNPCKSNRTGCAHTATWGLRQCAEWWATSGTSVRNKGGEIWRDVIVIVMNYIICIICASWILSVLLKPCRNAQIIKKYLDHLQRASKQQTGQRNSKHYTEEDDLYWYMIHIHSHRWAGVCVTETEWTEKFQTEITATQRRERMESTTAMCRRKCNAMK